MRDNRAISPGEPALVRTVPVVTLPVILVLVVPAALVLAVAVAAVPGESAARTRPAEILRSE
jgi:ABC-type lipoprotein release transport system permease subunit